MNIMLFAVWNRPEMLEVVTEHLVEAYNYHPFPDLRFVFAVEYPTDQKVLDLVKKFPLPTKKILVRKQRFALSKNVLEGMKVAMDLADDYVLFQADDIVVHKTFFKFYDAILNQNFEKLSTCTTANYKEGGDMNLVYRGHFYDAAGALITKDFYESYVRPCSIPHFYANRPAYITQIDKQYQEHWLPGKKGDYKYKYGQAEHNQQAGLINRLVDVAMIEEGYKTIKVDVSRVRNIGFYGRNRPGGQLKGNSYEERLAFLRNVITDRNKIYALTGTKQYTDYVNFESNLEDWDGTIKVQEV